MTKRILTILVLVLSLSLFASAAEISSADDMLTLMNTPSMWAGSYTLTTDINLADATNGLPQKPIGNTKTPFTGNFDGGGHTINGLAIDGAALGMTDNVGLFGYIQSSGTVTIENLTVNGTVSGPDENVGGLIGHVLATNVTIKNCINLCTVKDGTEFLGGIIGRLALSAETALISGCKNEGAVTATKSYAGGIAGFASNTKGSTTIEKCLNTGTVTTANGASAGIVGYWRVYAGAAGKCFVQDCMNTGAMVAGTSGYAGGIIAHGAGQNAEYTVTRCFRTGSVTASKASYVRPIVGRPAAAAVSAGGISNCYYTSTDSYVADTTGGGEIYVSDATVVANVSGLGENFVLVDGYTPELKAFHKHSEDGEYTITTATHDKICYCGEVAVSEEHTFANGVCDKCGAQQITCAHEGKYEVVEISPTCSMVGIKYEYCPDCSQKVGDNIEIPVDLTNHSGTLAMSFANGVVNYVCSDCGNVVYTDSALLTTVYVSENGKELAGNITAQIGTAENPFKNFTEAMQYAAYNTADVTVTILDSATTPAKYTTPAFTNTITVSGGTLNTNTRFIMNGPMVFEHLCFSDSGSTFIAAQEHKVVMGEGITVIGDGIYLAGGYEGGSAKNADISATGYSTDITIRSGVYRVVIGANRNLDGAYSGTVNITVGKTNANDTLQITNTFVTASLNYEGGNNVYATVVFDGDVDSIATFYAVSSVDAQGRFDVDVVVCGGTDSSKLAVSLKGSDYALNVYSDSRKDGADTFAAAIIGEENVQPYSHYCLKVNGEHPDANADEVCDNCGAKIGCEHERGEWIETSSANCASFAKYTWYCADCKELIVNITKDGDSYAADIHVSENYEWQFDGEKYYYTCTACKNNVEQKDAPTIYVSESGNDKNDGLNSVNAVASLTEAVSRIANVGGTVVVCGSYPLSNTTLPTHAKPITIKGSDTSDSFTRGGFKISSKTLLSLGGETVLDNLLFDGGATYVIACNWNNVTFGAIEAINNAQAYILLGKYNIKKNDDTLADATLTITEGALVSDHASDTETATRFYSRIYLGDSFGADGISVSNKTATLSATNADIGVLYTMSTSSNYMNNPVISCETTVNLYGRTRIDQGRTGDKNVSAADSTASLAKQTLNFFDNSYIGTNYYIRNVENTVLYVSGSTDGRTVPMDVGFTFYSAGSFATDETNMNVDFSYGTHSFAPALSEPFSYNADANAQKIVTVNKTDECVYTSKVTVEATPDANGTKLYSCTCGRRYTEEYEYSCEEMAHFYVANTDGTYTCKVCDKNFTAVSGDNVFAISSAVVANGTVTVTATVKGDFAAALVNVVLPSGFTFAEAMLPTVDGFACSGNANGSVYSISILSDNAASKPLDMEIKLVYSYENGAEAAGQLVEILVPELYNSDMENEVATTVCALAGRSDCAHSVTEDIITLAPTCSDTGLKKVICAECKTVIEMNAVVEVDSANHSDYACVSSVNGLVCSGCKAAVDAPTAPVIIMATPKAVANGKVEVVVSIKATAPIFATSFSVDAPEGFTLLSAESLIGDETTYSLIGQDSISLPFEAVVMNMTFEDEAVDFEVLKLTFSTDGADLGLHTVSVTPIETYNCEKDSVDTFAIFAEVSVEDNTVVGDLDGDGFVSIADALKLIRVILNNQTIANADVNGDGKVGLADVIRIMKLIAQ